MTGVQAAIAVYRSGMINSRVIVYHCTNRNVGAGLAHRIERAVLTRTADVVDRHTSLAVNGFYPCFAQAARCRYAVTAGIPCDLYDTVLYITSQRVTALLRQKLLYQLDIEHIAVVIPPAAVDWRGNRVFVDNFYAAGVLTRKLLCQFKGVPLAVFRNEVQKAAAVIVCLNDGVHITTEPVCFRYQFRKILAALFDTVLCAERIHRQSGRFRGLHNVLQLAFAFHLNNGKQDINIIADTVLLCVLLNHGLMREHFR